MKLFLKNTFVEYFSRVRYKMDGSFPNTDCPYIKSNVGSIHCSECDNFISKNSYKKYVCCGKKLLDLKNV
jgi:hypothetical protein